jgi:hypothetical protein
LLKWVKIHWCGSLCGVAAYIVIGSLFVCVCVCVCVTGRNQIDSDPCHTHINKDPITIHAATQPNEPHQCILTHFNNCNFSKTQTVCSLIMVFYSETCRSFLMSILMQIRIVFKTIQLCISWWKSFDNKHMCIFFLPDSPHPQ